MGQLDVERKAKRGPSRLAKTLRALLYISILGVLLAAWNAWTTKHDHDTAVGPANTSQLEFFLAAAERPDISSFFKSLPEDERVVMATRIGQHEDARMARLIAKCLGDFSEPARRALTESLAVLAKRYPAEVVSQLKESGSFQQEGIQSALRQAGDGIDEKVAAQLTVAEARANAAAYLVQSGKRSIPYVLPFLEAKDPDTRLVAADTLSKLGSTQAVPRLLLLYRGAKGDERLGYLTALSGIGDPRGEKTMAELLGDSDAPLPSRSQAALGLGRIGSQTAVTTLWRFASDTDSELAANVISALQLAGDEALRGSESLPLKIRVAAGIRSPSATKILRQGLQSTPDVIAAARASHERPEMVPALAKTVIETPSNAGDRADALVNALQSTTEGRQQLVKLRDHPVWGGLIWRGTQANRS